MKSELSKLHNHFVNEDPITKMMFDAFPDDFVVFGGMIVDYMIGNPHIIDYDVCLLNNRWEDGVEYLTTQRPHQDIWQFKDTIVPQKNFETTWNHEGKALKRSKGHLPWLVMLEPAAGYNVRFDSRAPIGKRWKKPYIALSKLNRTSVYDLIDTMDSVVNRIAITKTDVVMRDERPLECIKWRTFEYDGWCTDPQHAYARCHRYKMKKGFNVDDRLSKEFDKLLKYREQTQDVIKPENYGKYIAGNYLRIDLETDDVLDHIHRGVEIPKRYRIDYHYNDSGIIKD